MKNSKKINKTWMQFKVSTLSASITALILSGIPYYASASDIDIYQSGGNGPVMIYLMLDTSGSMNGDSFMQTDYGFPYKKTESITDSTICKDQYYYVGPGQGRYTLRNNGRYRDDGMGNGDYLQKTTQGCGLTYNKITNQNLCSSTTVTNNLKVDSGYIYTKSGTDLYCKVDLNETTTTAEYKQKIINTCDAIGLGSTTYNCYSRIVKLRQGLLNLINDSSIDENVSFALGEYPISSNNKSPQTILNFLKMDGPNKKKISDKVVALIADGGTPISPAYDTASKSLLSNIGSASSAGTSLECTGKGVYFLTDGEPTISYGEGSFNSILTNNSITAKNSKGLGSEYWDNIQKFAESLKESKYKIKTATVGFGGEYYVPPSAGADITYEGKTYYDCSKLSGNQQQLCEWGAKKIPKAGYSSIGGLGEGGFYNAQSSAELLKSVKSFMNEVTVPIEGTTMGSSTIPVDALNTSELQPYAYFPMFKPLIGTEDQLWAGNLKKFNVSEGSLFDVKKIPVFKNSSDFNAKLQDYWYTAEGKNPDEFLAFGGNLSQLQAKMKVLSESNAAKIKRNLLINDNGVLKPAVTVLAGNSLADREYLYGLLGYSTLTTQNLTDLKSKSYSEQLKYLSALGAPKADYQLGAIIHSSPLLLTQKGVIEYKSNAFTSIDREDYILFGTTQGVLHVLKAGQQNKQALNNGVEIDATGGEEVFSFVPQEMLTKQKTGFIESLAQKRSQTVANGGGFFYGIDGAWTAHTEYEASIYQTPQLDNNGNKVLDADKKEIMVQREGLQVDPKTGASHQYVYGGLRMGGRSYYGLNLTDISKPQMLFHINLAVATLDTDPLFHMGQSWSKPTVTYINWNGKKKLAMIVGGGYDEKYETSTYKKSDTDIVKGNGVYIFDAENGDLLWWGSSSAKDANVVLNTAKTRVETPASSNIATMTNSIPSRIKAVDRNGDGVTDHLYVGDLGGQVFRIDLSSEHHIDTDTKKEKKFTINAFKFADLNTTGKNPLRFYEAPTFTIHKNAGKNYAVITLASGDRSSPLVTNDANSQDSIVGLFDTGVTDVVPSALNIKLSDLRKIYPTSVATATQKGWYYTLPVNTAGLTKYQNRVLAEGIALDNDLYYSIFDPQKKPASTGSATSCTGGIIGESTAYKLCLPNGVCDGATDITKVGGLGSGIISLNIGPGSDSNSRTLVLNNKPPLVTPDEYVPTDKLLPRRWFEYSPYKVDSGK